jgi:phospholipid/cholesterol/gamma-HCH transport system substrate-binding protein
VKPAVWAPAWRFLVFASVCALAMFAMIAVFGQLRFASNRTYHAEFSSVSGLESGNFVRIAGVEVGKVTDIAIKDSTTAIVGFTTDQSVVLTTGTRALIRYENLIGGRFLALEEGAGELSPLQPGATIALDHTAPALDLDSLIGGFRPLFRALNPNQVNALTGQLVRAFQGQGPTVEILLDQTAALTATLADRDALIGQVITNLNTVLGSVSAQSKQFDTTVTSLAELVSGLAANKSTIAESVASVNGAAATVADLLAQSRPPLKKVLTESDRTATNVLSDYDFINGILTRLPDDYQKVARQGLYGDFFNFYLCDLYLKLNGKGGNPVFVKVIAQPTGRCTPK